MKCYNCGSFLYESEYCSACGVNVAIYKKIVKKSNEFYNKGLGYAQDRNLSEAVKALRISLKLFKGNVAARNLLGLVYVEMGEYTLGLTQWVMSKSMQNDNNLADYFLDAIQSNKSELDLMHTSIRKYNRAVENIAQGNYDLAGIQLKKLLNDNPNLIKGHQLLALLLIRKKKYAEAKLALKKAEKVDKGNPTTISYMTFVEQEIADEEKELTPTELKTKHDAEKATINNQAPLSGDDVIIPKSSYNEYNQSTMTIIQLIIGVIIGAAIVFFIVLPTKTKSLRTEAANQQAQLQAKIDELQGEIDSLSDTAVAVAKKESDTYKNLLRGYSAYVEENWEEAASFLIKIEDPEKLDQSYKAIYENISDESYWRAADILTDAGYYAFLEDDFSECIAKMSLALQYDPENQYALFFTGCSFSRLGETQQALPYLKKYVELYPDGNHVEDANTIIDAIE